jgi:glycosyltransferase involved in cell wall biosynthesis
VREPLVTIGVPVYHGQEALPALLECLRTQSYEQIDVVISADGGDQASAEACGPFVRKDPRFRLHVQPSRLGWAGNTDWTMRQRRGDFYVYQQHDDWVSPTYIADLVEASARWPDASVCFAKVKLTGQLDQEELAPSILGDPITRALKYLRRLDWVPFRGLIRGSALDQTSGLLLSDFDPFDSFGTEFRFMAELARAGEFRFVEGPTYFKDWHGKNLSAKRESWSRRHEMTAYACLAAWMIEVVAPAGASPPERHDLFKIVLERFAGDQDLEDWIASAYVWQRRNQSKPGLPLATIRTRLKKSGDLGPAPGAPMPLGRFSASERPALRRQIFARLKSGGRFDPGVCMNTTWAALEREMLPGDDQRST